MVEPNETSGSGFTEIEVVPRPAPMFEGMRSFGYTLDTALADVIDNSITAKASRIDILSEFFEGDPTIGILDNGTGMSAAVLHEALRPGSSNPLDERDPNDLGRFGLGLKTASVSQCRRLTVVSRHEGITSAAVWDLDRVAAADRWVLEIPHSPEGIPFIENLGESGTLVVWQKLDRLVGDVEDEDALTAANESLEAASRHLELVFTRFLAGARGVPKVAIHLNWRSLVPLDPFRSDHPATSKSPEQVLHLNGHEIRIQAFTLPHHSKVSSNADWVRHEGKGGYVKSQGFYVFRGDRLIIHGTWFGLARQLELTKLCRVRIDLPNSLDSAWKIDIKKSTATPPLAIRKRLQTLIETISGPSTRIYTYRGRRLTDGLPAPVWIRRQKDGKIRFSVNREHPVIATALRGAGGESLREVLGLVESAIPLDAFLADLGNNPDQVETAQIPEDELLSHANTIRAALVKAGASGSDLVALFTQGEPFRSYPDLMMAYMNEMGIGND